MDPKIYQITKNIVNGALYEETNKMQKTILSLIDYIKQMDNDFDERTLIYDETLGLTNKNGHILSDPLVTQDNIEELINCEYDEENTSIK